MYRVVTCILTFVFLASVAAGEDVFVLEKSRPVTIVLADSPTIAEQTAAKELNTYLSKMTGVPCVIVPEAKAAKCASYVGPNALAKQAGIDGRELDREEWILRARDGDSINYLQDREKATDAALGLTTPNALAYLDRGFFATVNGLRDEAERLAAGDPVLFENIGRERVPVDAALLNLHRRDQDQLPAGGNPPADLLTLFRRYEKNSLLQAEIF